MGGGQETVTFLLLGTRVVVQEVPCSVHKQIIVGVQGYGHRDYPVYTLEVGVPVTHVRVSFVYCMCAGSCTYM